jgi:alanine racemase
LTADILATTEAQWAPHRVGTALKWAEVDVAQLRNNARALTDFAAPAQVMAMVKANGYGHGALVAARAALSGGATWLGVSSPDEAVQLRDAGIDAPILMVGWTPPTACADLIRRSVDVTVCSADDVKSVADAAEQARSTARVQVKLDTGMNRFGARPEAVAELVSALTECEKSLLVTGIFTHFADADGDDVTATEMQHEVFMHGVDLVQKLAPGASVHCCNSAATLRFRDYHHDMVRLGIVFYGYPPPNCDGVVEVAPAMRFASVIVLIKNVPTGERVGYGLTWQAKRPSRIAVVPAGYGDGVSRALSNNGFAAIKGRLAPIVGRISMDQTTLDVTDLNEVAVGDEVTWFGNAESGITAADVEARLNTISYEVLCDVSARVPRTLINDDNP